MADLHKVRDQFSKLQDFAKVIFQLSLIFKGVGASRPYYTCEKIHESYRKIVVKKDTNPEKLVEVWALYPKVVSEEVFLRANNLLALPKPAVQTEKH